MIWRDVGYLCKKVETLDKLRKPQKSFKKRLVYCNEKGVKRSEFYQAQAQGYKPELCVELKAIEYHQEEYFEFDEKMYRVLRTYPVKNECVELTCVALVVE